MAIRRVLTRQEVVVAAVKKECAATTKWATVAAVLAEATRLTTMTEKLPPIARMTMHFAASWQARAMQEESTRTHLH